MGNTCRLLIEQLNEQSIRSNHGAQQSYFFNIITPATLSPSQEKVNKEYLDSQDRAITIGKASK